MARQAYLEYDNRRVELGLVQSIDDSIKVNVNNPIIPMLTAEEQFGMDTGATQSISVDTIHLHGESRNNADWLRDIDGLINRWQARTNGCRFNYIPDSDLSDFISEYDDNCYVRSVSLTWKAGVPDIINASFSLVPGSIKGKTSGGINPAIRDDMYIAMSNPYGEMPNRQWFRKLYGWENGEFVDCVSSVEVTGGFNQPFESVEIKVSRRKLLETYNFTQGGKKYEPFVVGTTIIEMGLESDEYSQNRRYILRAIDSDDATITLTAFNIAELLKTTPTHRAIGNGESALGVIRDLLEWGVTYYLQANITDSGPPTPSPQTIVQTGNSWKEGDYNLKFVDQFEDFDLYGVDIPEGTPVWYALQICLGGRYVMMFSLDKCYIMNAIAPPHQQYDGVLDLTEGSEYADRLCGVPKLGQGKVESVFNKAIIMYGPYAGGGTQFVETPNEEGLKNSQDRYGIRTTTLILPGVTSEDTALWIGRHYLYSKLYPAPSVRFKLAEDNDADWVHKVYGRYFEYKDLITDTDVRMYNKGVTSNLVLYKCKFPEMTAEYTYGALTNSALAEKIAMLEQGMQRR